MNILYFVLSISNKRIAIAFRQFLILFFVVGIGFFPAVSSGEINPLNILLTNDDGWNSTGIQKLKEALESAGHHVTLVAPAGDRSASSASLTVALITVVQKGANEFAVDGTPVTCVSIGTQLMTEPPDLVVSGTNHGVNLGLTTPFSGTVGATISP